MKYPAIIHKGETEYGIFLPDFPGVVSGGATVSECLHNVQDAVESVYEVMGLTDFPEASALDDVVASEEARNGVVMLADIDPAFLNSKSVRINVSVPEYLLAQIDRKAHAQGLSRSAYMVQAALA